MREISAIEVEEVSGGIFSLFGLAFAVGYGVGTVINAGIEKLQEGGK